MSRKRTPTAYWGAASLLRSLSQSGWGELANEVPGVRLVLRGLVDRLNDADARGKVTQYQLAECTGLSVRWVRKCLGRLEDLGLIRWWRGGFSSGVATPSFIEISKRRLVEFIKLAKATVQEKREANKAARQARMAALKHPYARVKSERKAPRKNTSDHAELATALRPLTGECPAGTLPLVKNKSKKKATPEITPSEMTREERLEALEYGRQLIREKFPQWQRLRKKKL